MMGPSDLGVTARETEVNHKAILRPRSWLMCLEVRWVNAIWTVLERTRATPAMDRTSSLRVNRPTSLISNSEADGSASTYYVPRPPGTAPGSEGHLSPSPFAGPSRQTFTTDDAVIQTTGGFTASLAQRGSRRLAVGGLERGRSLRRVASEGDLSESAGVQEEPPSYSRVRASSSLVPRLHLCARYIASTVNLPATTVQVAGRCLHTDCGRLYGDRYLRFTSACNFRGIFKRYKRYDPNCT